MVRERDLDCPVYFFKKWRRACVQEERVELPSTFKQGSLVRPSTLEKKERAPPTHALKQEERSRQVIRGKRRELHYLVSRLSVVAPSKRGQCPPPPLSKTTYELSTLSSKTRRKLLPISPPLPLCERRDPLAGPLPQHPRREAPLTSREGRELCLPFCRQEENSLLS